MTSYTSTMPAATSIMTSALFSASPSFQPTVMNQNPTAAATTTAQANATTYMYTGNTTSPTAPPYTGIIDKDEPHAYKMVQMVWYIIIACIGSPGNILTLIVLFREKMYRTPSVVYIMSMTLSDTLNCMLVSPESSQTVRWGRAAFSPELCYFFGIAIDVCNSCSHIHILAISFDRFYAVTFPLKYRTVFTTKRTVMVCAGLWGAVLLVFPIMVYAIGGEFTFMDTERVCTCNWVKPPWFPIFMVLVIYANPVFLSVILYCIAVFRVYRQSRQIQASNANSKEAKKTNTALRLTKLAGVIMGIYLMMWFPWSICTASLFVGLRVDPKVYATAVCFGTSNACVNNIVYSLMNEKVRKGYKKLFAKCGLHKYIKSCDPKREKGADLDNTQTTS